MFEFFRGWTRTFLESEYQEVLRRRTVLIGLLAKSEKALAEAIDTKEKASFPFKVHTTKDGVMWRKGTGEWVLLKDMDNSHLANSVNVVMVHTRRLEDKLFNHQAIIAVLVREQKKRKKARAKKGSK